MPLAPYRLNALSLGLPHLALILSQVPKAGVYVFPCVLGLPFPQARQLAQPVVLPRVRFWVATDFHVPQSHLHSQRLLPTYITTSHLLNRWPVKLTAFGVLGNGLLNRRFRRIGLAAVIAAPRAVERTRVQPAP